MLTSSNLRLGRSGDLDPVARIGNMLPLVVNYHSACEEIDGKKEDGTGVGASGTTDP